MALTEQTRRAFLKTMGLGAASVAVVGCRAASESEVPQPAPDLPSAQVGLQLWTVRDQIEQDMMGTLRKVAAMGYRAVETAFFPEHVSMAEAGRRLKEAELSVLGAHVELPIGEHKDVMLATAEAYECDRMIWHGWPEDERYHSIEGTKRLADEYNEAYAFCTANGLQLGLHNHWWEFHEVEGQYPFYLLLDLIEPDILFEIDTYWTKVAGVDPAQVVGDFGKRAPLLHIKDGPALETEGPMVAVGQGSQDFPAIAEAAAGATEWMIVELDACETDMMEAVAQSFAYLTENGLARG